MGENKFFKPPVLLMMTTTNAPSPSGTMAHTEISMNLLDAWHELTYTDGILFSLWVGIMYYGKCWIDNKFDKKKEK